MCARSHVINPASAISIKKANMSQILQQQKTQLGVTLIEMMVGISIGLLVVAAAMGALMVSRSISGTVSDASAIQQQAGYAMRVIGNQLRQAGSLYLNPNPTNAASENVLRAPVAFEASTPASGGSALAFNPAIDTLSGPDSTLTVGYRRYKEPVYTDSTDQALARNCAGGPANASSDLRVESIFTLDGAALRCGGNDTAAAPQPIVQNVADFQVRYLLQDNTTPGNSKIQYVTAATVGTDWSKVQAVQVCLVLYGHEPTDMPTGSSYIGCNGNSVDMTTLTGARARRMHIAFRSVFQLRSQGLIGTVL